jgi:hypothetical protein
MKETLEVRTIEASGFDKRTLLIKVGYSSLAREGEDTRPIVCNDRACQDIEGVKPPCGNGLKDTGNVLDAIQPAPLARSCGQRVKQDFGLL